MQRERFPITRQCTTVRGTERPGHEAAKTTVGAHARSGPPGKQPFDQVPRWWTIAWLLATSMALAAYLVTAHGSHHWAGNDLSGTPLRYCRGTLIGATLFGMLAFLQNASSSRRGRTWQALPGGRIDRFARWVSLAISFSFLVVLIIAAAVSIAEHM